MADIVSEGTANTIHHKTTIPNEPRRDELDGWRAIAILSVLVGHFLVVPGINAGRLGVELFFVLSGLLMAELLFVREQTIGSFLRRRVSRVWPALLFFLGLMTIVYSIPSLHIVGTLTFTQNYVSIYSGHVPPLDHLWSLSIEEWTYILLAVVALVVRSFRAKVVPFLGALIASCVNGLVQYLRLLDYYEVYWRTDVRSASILMGAVVYLIVRERNYPRFVPIAAFLIGVALSLNSTPDFIKYTAGSFFLAIAVGTLKDAPPWLLKVLGSAPLKWCARLSFSLYLWQQPFFKMIDKYPTVVLFFCVLITSMASFYFVEQPARRYLNRRVSTI